MTLKGEYEPSATPWVRDQVEQYEASGGTEANTLPQSIRTMTGLSEHPDWPIVIITSIGHKSGKLRKNPVMRVEKDGVYAAIASRGGAPEHPEWYYNLVAKPEIDLQDGPEPKSYIARLAQGDERAEWWERAVAAYAPYAAYQEKTERQIPVFILEPRS